MIEVLSQYRTNDGAIHDTEADAEAHICEVMYSSLEDIVLEDMQGMGMSYESINRVINLLVGTIERGKALQAMLNILD